MTGCERMACTRFFHPTATHLALERLIINKLQKQGWLWVLSEAPKSRAYFNNLLIINNLLKHQLDMGWKNMPTKSGASCILLNY